MAFVYNRKQALSNRALNPGKDIPSTQTKEQTVSEKRRSSGGSSSQTGSGGFTPAPAADLGYTPLPTQDTNRLTTIVEVEQPTNFTPAPERDLKSGSGGSGGFTPAPEQDLRYTPAPATDLQKAAEQQRPTVVKAKKSSGNFTPAPSQDLERGRRPERELPFVLDVQPAQPGYEGRSLNIFRNLYRGFTEVSLFSGNQNQRQDFLEGYGPSDTRLDVQQNIATGARNLGRILGIGSDIALIGSIPSGVGAAQTATTAAKASSAGQTATRAVSAARSVPIIGNLAVGTAGITAAGLGGYEATKEFLNIRSGRSRQERQLAGENLDIFRQASAAERQDKGFIRQFGQAALPGIFGDEPAFVAGARQAGANYQTTEALRKERQVRNRAQLGGLLASGAASEIVGQANVVRAGARSFAALFSQIGQAGFGEAFAQAIVTQKASGDPRGMLETTKREIPGTSLSIETSPLGEAILAGGAGFLSAGLLGGATGVSKVKGKLTTSKVLETIGFTLDPLEKPSDILAEMSVTPVITPVPTFTETFAPQDQPKRQATTQTPTPSPTEPILFVGPPQPETIGFTSVGPVPIAPSTPVQIMTGVPVNTPTEVSASSSPSDSNPFIPINPITPVDVPTDVPLDTIIPVDVPTDVPTDVPLDTIIPVDVPTDVPLDTIIPVDVPTDVPLDTIIPVDVPANVPVFTPLLRAQPPLPLFGPLGSGQGSGRGRKERVSFREELKVSQKVFRGLIGLPGGSALVRRPQPQAKKKKKKTKTKTKKGSKPKKEDEFFNFLGLGSPIRSQAQLNKIFFG